MSNKTILNLEIIDPGSTQLTTIQAYYGVVCLALMVFFLYYLGVKKRFHSPFYRLAQMDLFVNICIYLNTWIAMRLEKFEMCIPWLRWIEETVPGALTFSRYLANYFFHLQFLSAAIMALYRIMIMGGKGLKDNKYWNRFIIIYYISVSVYSAMPNYLFYSGFPSRTSIVNGTLIRTRYTDLYNSLALCNAVFSTVYFIIMAALGVTAIIQFKKLAKTMFSTSTDNTLTQVVISYSVVYSGILFYCVFNGIDSQFDIYSDSIRLMSTAFLGFSSDLMTLSLPFILMIYDGNVRREIFGRYSQRVQSTSTTIGYT